MVDCINCMCITPYTGEGIDSIGPIKTGMWSIIKLNKYSSIMMQIYRVYKKSRNPSVAFAFL